MVLLLVLDIADDGVELRTRTGERAEAFKGSAAVSQTSRNSGNTLRLVEDDIAALRNQRGKNAPFPARRISRRPTACAFTLVCGCISRPAQKNNIIVLLGLARPSYC